MRILEVNKYLYPKGGAEVYVLALLDLLAKNGQKVICFSQRSQKNIKAVGEEFFISDLDLSGSDPSAIWRWPRIFWSPHARRQIKKLIEKYPPDIVHLHNIYHQISPSILSALKHAGVPVVMTVHDFKLITPLYTLRADGRPAKKSPWSDWLLKAEFAWHRRARIYERNIDLFLAPSEFVREQLVAAGFAPEKIAVLPLFAPDDFFTKTVSQTRAKAAEEKYIFAFGRLDESKGFEDLIRAFAELKIRGLKLKIAGDGPDRARLAQIIKALRLEWQIELIGQQPHDAIKKLIANSAIVVNCSKVHETFGLAVLEAMAQGKPIVAAKVGAIPELISDGENGLLYDVADAGDLKRQLQTLLNNAALRQKLAAKARLSANAYRPEKHLKQLLKLFDQAILNHKPPIKRIHPNWIRGIFIVALLSLLLMPFYYQKPQPSEAQIETQNYPRLANLYWKNPITIEEAAALARWDLLVLDMQTQTNSAEAITEIRRLNPNIIILAYTTAVEMPTTRLAAVEPSGAGLWHDLAELDDDAWHLKTYDGQEAVFWPGNVMMNLDAKNSAGTSYGEVLSDFLVDRVLASGLWDGLFFDNTWATVDSVNAKIDIDNDGRADSATKINANWRLAQNDFFNLLRRRLGGNYLLIGNGAGQFGSLNGRMFESFPEYWEGGWTGSMSAYQSATSTYAPALTIINSDSNNTGNAADYRAMRFGLASALMFNGYYSFDYGSNLREQFWWYDEYDADLGAPISAAKNLLSAATTITTGVWQREFERGLALVNSTDKVQTVTLFQDYQKISGAQDPLTNNGAIVRQVTIPAQDGLILLKKVK